MTTVRFSQHNVREVLCDNGEFILYRTRLASRESDGKVLLLVPTRPSRESAGKLEHEFSLSTDIHPD